jgi:serine phosphatase RsbU (regulator of sigma subunit)
MFTIRNFTLKASITCILLLVVLLGACKFPKTPTVQYAQKGVIDLRNDSLENVSLRGEYAFVWQKIAEPSEMRQIKQYLYLPNEWNKYGYSPQGYATYSLQVVLPPLQKNIALYLPNVATAYRLWFNNQLVYELGKLSTTPQNALASYQDAIIPIPDSLLKNPTLQITLQISNYEHFRGGVYGDIRLGKLDSFKNSELYIRDFELFSIGSLLFMMTFHGILFLFLSHRQTKESLYLSLLCGVVIARALVINVGSQYWLEIFPNSSFEWMIRIEFLATYFVPLLILKFCDALLPQVLSAKITKICTWLGIIIILSALLPVQTYLYSLPVFYLVIFSFYLLLFYACIKARKNGIKEAYLILLSLLLSFVFSILEMMHHSGWLLLPYANISHQGMIAFLFIQSFVISHRIAKAFSEVAYLTKNLEKEVEKRTQELENKNLQIERVNENMMASIRYAQRIQNATLPSQRIISKFLEEHFIFYRPRDIVSGDFYWFQHKGESVYVAVADCTGHGVPGAIMSVMGDISLDYAFFRQDYTQLSDLLAAFDKELIKLLNKNVNPDEERAHDGIVIALCKINLETKELIYTAANSPICIVRDGVLTELNPDKHIIGGNVVEAKDFTTQTFQLKEGDMIYLFSDGYYDQFGGEKKKKYGTRKFKELLLQIAPKPIEEQKKHIEDEFEQWKASYSQIDDVLVMGIRVK